MVEALGMDDAEIASIRKIALSEPRIVNSNVSVKIYDVSGRVINTISIEEAKEIIRIETDNLSQGSYLIVLEAGKIKLRKRLIITN